MNTVDLCLPDNMPRIKRRLTKKALPSPKIMSYIALQRHRARSRQLLYAQWRGEKPYPPGLNPFDDVVLLDKHGRRIAPPAYAMLRIDQLPQFKKG